MEKSWSRQQYEAEIAASKQARRAARTPSKWGKCIPAGSEDEIQATFIEWVDTYKEKYPDLKLIHSVPNGSHKSKVVRWIMQLCGLRPGVPDIHLAKDNLDYRKDGYFGLWIEFKTPKGVLSAEQKQWAEMLTQAGHLVIVCRSWTEAVNAVIKYLRLPLETL
jgi:hypothetical protein